MESIRERRAVLEERARRQGLRVARWSFGDGTTRYRFRREDDLDGFGADEYFGGDGLGTVFGLREAEVWLEGYIAARRQQ